MQILNKCFVTIWRAQNISFWHKANAYWFFARYVLFAAITLAVLLVPPMAMFVDRWEWLWPEYYFLVSVNFALAVSVAAGCCCWGAAGVLLLGLGL
jgi:beta-mannan synthase